MSCVLFLYRKQMRLLLRSIDIMTQRSVTNGVLQLIRATSWLELRLWGDRQAADSMTGRPSKSQGYAQMEREMPARFFMPLRPDAQSMRGTKKSSPLFCKASLGRPCALQAGLLRRRRLESRNGTHNDTRTSRSNCLFFKEKHRLRSISSGGQNICDAPEPSSVSAASQPVSLSRSFPPA